MGKCLASPYSSRGFLFCATILALGSGGVFKICLFDLRFPRQETTPHKPRSPVIRRAALGYRRHISKPVDAHSVRLPPSFTNKKLPRWLHASRGFSFIRSGEGSPPIPAGACASAPASRHAGRRGKRHCPRRASGTSPTPRSSSRCGRTSRRKWSGCHGA